MKKDNQNEILKHSTAHVLAAAVLEMFGDAKFGTGPATEDGFYYDFMLGRTLIPEDLEILEEKMREIIKANHPFEKEEISIESAIEHFESAAQPYKVELIKELEKEGNENVSVYKTGSFVDLCSGPHLDSTGEINSKAFKLTKISGAYWRADENNDQMQRIYGVVFSDKKELGQYLKQVEEAKERDHRKIGKELDLFVFSELVGKGLPLFTPKGTAIWKELESFIVEEERKRGYLRTHTPDITRVELYKKSGHWEHYQDDMYPTMNIYDEEYALRPMTCPHQFMIYNSKLRSHKELPLRYAEMAKLYRKEKSGELSGLIRHAGGWTLADAHIVCKPDQIEEEFESVIELIQYVMKTLQIDDYWYRFSKWDPKNKKNKYINSPKDWESTQASMKKILDKMKLEYVEAEDEAAFYGPKLDIQLRNVNGKEDTAFTVQIDFAMPERFDMSYVDGDGEKKRPMVIHRSSIGCIERTMAFLIEKFAGEFPTWLSPVQVSIVPVSEKFNDYAEGIKKELFDLKVRVELNNKDESLGKRIREEEKQKVPYVLVVGEKEEKDKTVAVRKRGEKNKQDVVGVDEFLESIVEEISSRNM